MTVPSVTPLVHPGKKWQLSVTLIVLTSSQHINGRPAPQEIWWFQYKSKWRRLSSVQPGCPNSFTDFVQREEFPTELTNNKQKPTSRNVLVKLSDKLHKIFVSEISERRLIEEGCKLRSDRGRKLKRSQNTLALRRHWHWLAREVRMVT